MKGAIWAQSLDGVIGDGEDMPWYLPEDLAHFKETTLDSPVLMGRRTWESLPKRPLPRRENIVVSSREPGEWSAGATVVPAVPTTFAGWVMGGAQLYEAMVAQMDTLVVTLIDAHLEPALRERAVRAPDIPATFYETSDSGWLESERGRLKVGVSPVPLRYRFLTYSRRVIA
ncbi:Dihydrofolate reductase [Corynebacterium renale]|uniref:dihydrofolate reductase n=1 Tax=Corynebacterium renale TaxID=1724 RepID=A0A2A9DJT8_9CORY|nr:dihydrofolate reductase [Corynebacterium renale]PFG27007.1 dihydrofolate reductase [Corynebacterium renale]SQG64265.1 Dihydrofolate reductase [Corynebacterium renale]SQI24459.1 Dihydrofolate reductase [Corynebacterium renale]STC94748.1 Dihydrofolate reductase [Corynebacterium renale]